jgi:hypothetical protein
MESYKIGVSIVLANGVSGVLAVIAKDLLGLKGPIGSIEKQFASWNSKLVGVAGILGGTAIIGGLVKIASHGKELLDQQTQMLNLGLAQNDILALTSNYYKNVAQAIPTSTASEYLKTIKELRAVTGGTPEGMAEVQRLAPKAMKVDALLSNTFGTEMHGEYYKLLRAEEMKGIATDEKKREAFTDAAFSYITAFGGKLHSQDYQTLARRGGAAFINMKPEAMGPLSVLTADLGGDATGTAMMTFQQLFTGATTMSKQQGEMWQKLGLINMDKVTKTGFGGSRLQLGLGAIAGSQEHNGDMPGYIKDVLYPAIVKAANNDPAAIEEIIGKIAPNRNANKLVHMFGQSGFQDQIMKDMGLAGQVLPIDPAYQNFINKNPKGVEAAFNDQYRAMMEAIGAPLMQAALPVMQGVTSMFTSLGSFANANPGAIKIIAEGLGAIAVALAAAGVVTLVSFAAVPALIVGVGAAVAALIAINWQAITSIFDSIKSAIAAFIEFLASIPGKLRGMLPDAGWGPERDESGHMKKPGVFDKYLWGDPADSAPKKNMMFSPGSSQMKPQPVSLSLSVDGRTLAQAVSEQLSSLMAFPNQAAAHDGYAGWADGDHQYTST